MMMKNLLPENTLKIRENYFLGSEYITDAIYQGIYLGRDGEKNFVPSLMFLKIIEKDLNEITLNKKNSWKFTCNKIIDHYVHIDAKKCKHEKMARFFLVKTGHNELIGIALKKNNAFIPLWDIGHLLRRELDLN